MVIKDVKAIKAQIYKTINALNPITIPEITELTGLEYNIVSRIVKSLHSDGAIVKSKAMRDELGNINIAWAMPAQKKPLARNWRYPPEKQ